MPPPTVVVTEATVVTVDAAWVIDVEASNISEDNSTLLVSSSI